MEIKNTGIMFSIFVILLFAASACAQGVSPEEAAKKDRQISDLQSQVAALQKNPTNAEVGLKMGMRKLWEDHVTWTRNYVISAVSDLPDTSLAAQRLLKNQEDIGNAIKPLYGEEAGNKLTALLKDHILIAADIIKAAKAGSANGVAEGQKKWSQNADEIAALLSGANPNWPKQALKDMLQMHLDLTTEEVVARLTKDYARDIAAYDKVHEHALGMADALSGGIIKQFPQKFK